MFIQSFLELTDEQFTYIPIHLHNRHLFEMTEDEEEEAEGKKKKFIHRYLSVNSSTFFFLSYSFRFISECVH